MRKSRLYNLIFILQFFCYGTAVAQFFGLIQKDPQQHYWTALSYPQDGKYRVLNCIEWSSQNSSFYKRCQVLVYDSDFRLADSINLINGVIPIRSEPLKKGNRLFWAGYYCDTINPDPDMQQLVILELDTNYHHIALHKINNLANRRIITTNIVSVANRFFVSNGTSLTALLSYISCRINSQKLIP